MNGRPFKSCLIPCRSLPCPAHDEHASTEREEVRPVGRIARRRAASPAGRGGAAEERQIPVALLIDKLQYFNPNEPSALIMAMHKMQQSLLPVSCWAQVAHPARTRGRIEDLRGTVV